jgi:hypothetical protein
MSAIEPVDHPPTGFSYSYWFSCTGCRGRVEVNGDLFELQCTGQADFSVCACGTAVDVTDQSPTLRNTEDIALQTDSVARLVWYHSGRYEHWPDLKAYTAEVTAMAMQTTARFERLIDPDRLIATKLSLALHLGTYEATIENLLRRLEDQDRADLFETRYWLHRVEIALAHPDDLHPEVIDEFQTMFGDVELAQLQALGAHAVRYVNLHEAIGSVSLAIDPSLVCTVSTIELPVAEATLAATASAAAATTRMVAAAQSDDDGSPEWSEFVEILQSEYLSGVNPQVREPFLNAVGAYNDPADFHRRFRVVGGLLMRPDVVVDILAKAPRRHLPAS